MSGRRHWWARAWVVAALITVVLATVSDGVAAVERERGPAPLGPGDVTVTLGIEHSLFDPARVRVTEGTRVRFVVDNTDPIGHELIVGPPDVHARHSGGTHGQHPAVPGEVSVDPNRRAVTTYRFDEAGTVEFACHLPGHYEYGMRGEVEVTPAD
ncbi:MAG TPA: plastocyanin/azurin family copper-binding protein [Euzebyales bacterium]|nr:plastocyanin/azurin family copper-binding protein [Euzebyales bacterium]